jgi:hypothetical protein
VGDLPVIALGIVGAAITGLVTYLVARRDNSGQVDTTKADRLWTEGNVWRDELRADVDELKRSNRECEDRCSTLRDELLTSRGEVITLRGEVLTLRRQLDELKGR